MVPEQWAPLTNALFTSPTGATQNYPRPVIMSGVRGPPEILGALGQHPSGSLVTINIFYVEITTYRTSVVAAARNTDSIPQGACHRCLLQLRWWLQAKITTAPQGGRHRRLLQLRWCMLPKILIAPLLRGVAIDVFFNFGGGCCQKYWQHPPGGLPSTSSSTSVVATAKNTDSTPQGGHH
jgi:hypothetical protein